MEQHEIQVPIEVGVLIGDLSLTSDPRGIVLFAHGSGSSRRSPRNRAVAEYLNANRLATLLIDLLTPEEEEIDERTRQLRFDIDLLTTRLISATKWLQGDERTNHLSIGTFGSSTGAAAALKAEPSCQHCVCAVVSRGGRPDLAIPILDQVRAATLFIVGGNDGPVIGMNEEAFAHLTCPKHLELIPGAGHLFSEPGTLEQVATLAAGWFAEHLA